MLGARCECMYSGDAVADVDPLLPPDTSRGLGEVV